VSQVREAIKAVAKRGYEELLWARVGATGMLDRRRGRKRPYPSSVPATAVLSDSRQVEAAVAEARRLGLPLHPDRPKNWDALGAVGVVLQRLGRNARVLDAGAARYSVPLPWLRLYGLRSLTGLNLEFSRSTRHGPVEFRYGDVTDTGLESGSLDAVLCMSVVEHGVPLKPFLAEVSRILRTGGLLCLSTDYDRAPPSTEGLVAYGTPVRILGPDDIRDLVEMARDVGLDLVGDLPVEHVERPVAWKRFGLRYTFILLTFERSALA